ncbi:hypothetical protein V9K67_00070 [Paraflavisolibacter sp. H34]|uniref:hypothetical protein n=1 Tax=Huijunlia imazamoxiresistens TaxID=3127457 RepID=UPI003018F323
MNYHEKLQRILEDYPIGQAAKLMRIAEGSLRSYLKHDRLPTRYTVKQIEAVYSELYEAEDQPVNPGGSSQQQASFEYQLSSSARPAVPHYENEAPFPVGPGGWW